MRTYPISLVIENQPVLVVGGGPMAERRADGLLAAGADVTVIAPEVTDQIRKWVDTSRMTHRSRAYRDADLDGMTLVVAATNDNALNAKISERCRKKHIPVNVVNAPELCTFIIPSVLHRGDLTIAVASPAVSSTLSRAVCDHLSKDYGHEYTAYTALLREMRRRAGTQIKFADATERREFLERLENAPVLDLIRQGKSEEAHKILETMVDDEKKKRGGQ